MRCRAGSAERRSIAWRTALWAIVAGAVVAHAPAQGPPDANAVLMREFLADLRKREATLRELTVRCTGRMHQSYLDLGGPAWEGVPKEGVSYDCERRFYLDDSKFRYEVAGSIWNVEAKKLFKSHYIDSFDGSVTKQFVPRSSNPAPRGVVYAHMYNRKAESPHAWPVLLICRPTDKRLGIGALESYRLAEGRVTVRHHSCLLLEHHATERRVFRLFVDPGLDHMPVRMICGGPTHDELQIDWHWDDRKKRPASLVGWKVQYLLGQQLESSFEGKVVEWTEKVDEELFHITFPVGTWVVDHTKTSELGKFTEYMVRERDLREVKRADLGATFPVLMNTEPGMAFRSPHGFFRYAVGAAMAIVGLLVILRYITILRTRKGST